MQLRDANHRLLGIALFEVVLMQPVPAGLPFGVANQLSRGGVASAQSAASQPTAADRKAFEHASSASRLYVQGKYREAIKELEVSLELNPLQPRAAKALGISYQLIEDLPAAENAFRRATKLDPKDSEAWFFLGRACYTDNFFDQALAALRTAMRLDPSDVRVREYLALTLEAIGQTGQALDEYEEGLRQAKGQGKPSWSLHLTYGILLRKLNRFQESERELTAARRLNPELWQVHFELGKLYYETEKPDLAIAELNAALQSATATDGDRTRVLRLLSRAYYSVGREEDARKAMAMAEKNTP